MTARFVVGSGPAIDEPDVVQLVVSDEWPKLWAKVQTAFRYSLDFQYDYLFKCDDDTYVVPERLEAAVRSAVLAPYYPVRPGATRDPRPGEPDYIGCADSTETVDGGYAHGGAGYFLSRRRVEYLANCTDSPYDWWGEDGWVGHNLSRVTRLYLTPLLHHDRTPYPLPANRSASCHRLTQPGEMLLAHSRYLSAVPALP